MSGIIKIVKGMNTNWITSDKVERKTYTSWGSLLSTHIIHGKPGLLKRLAIKYDAEIDPDGKSFTLYGQMKVKFTQL